MSKLFNVVFGKYNWLGNNVIMINSSIDDFSYIAEGSVISETKMGKFCSIGPSVRTGPGKHPTHTFVSTHPSIYSNPTNLLRNFSKEDNYKYRKDIVIGNDVWIGANAIILNGIKIGDGAIIGANSVITADVEPYAIVVGTPGKLIKYRFSQEEIDFLLKLKWWDKSNEWIELNSENLLDIKKLINLNAIS
nr:CatB-related O-acetyltransferase [Chryseobacterium paludis]